MLARPLLAVKPRRGESWLVFVGVALGIVATATSALVLWAHS